MTIISPSRYAYSEAAATLHEGGVIAFATETVYGLGCDTTNEAAIEKVYALKGRPTDNPMIAHVLDVSWVHSIANKWDERCELLAKKFWPGALTIVLPRRKSIVPASACGGLDTIAIRCPSHPVAMHLLASFGASISAPSANRSGYISPTTAQHVQDEFEDAVTIIDGGACEQGIESTVISMVGVPTILRLGSVSKIDLEQVLGAVFYRRTTVQSDSPGTAARHYAPRTSTCIRTSEEMNAIQDNTCAAIVHTSAPIESLQTFQLSANPKDYAAQLYAVLRKADACGASSIVIEQPPTTEPWSAVNDRLARCVAT